MTQKKVHAARVSYFESGRYMRGDGEYQKLFNELKIGGHNPKFIWLYETYYLWHTQRKYFGTSTILNRAKDAGIDAEFAQQVASTVQDVCEKFVNLTSSLAVDDHALLDVCLNEEHYYSLCLQLIPGATKLLNALDEFMDILLFHLNHEVTIMDKLPPLPWPKPCRSNSSNFISDNDNDNDKQVIRRNSSDENMQDTEKLKSPHGFSLSRLYKRLSNMPTLKLSRSQSPTSPSTPIGCSPK